MPLSKKRNLIVNDYNNSAKTCNPCMNACKKVDNKLNKKKLSSVNINEMKELLKISVSLDS